MTIKAGDRLPDVKLAVMGKNGPEPVNTKDYFAGRRVALFSAPGAYTPTCHKKHLPGVIAKADEIKSKGVNAVAITAVNDIFALDAWIKESGGGGKIEALADGSATFAKALGLDLDLTEPGLGVRGKRYAALIDDGVVKWINVEENSGEATVSTAEAALAHL